jgi:hypothetical protein
MKGKILALEFFPHTHKPKEPGLKWVLFRIDDRDSGKLIGFDYGFANFDNDNFEEMGDQHRRAWVVKWAEQPNPQLIL